MLLCSAVEPSEASAIWNAWAPVSGRIDGRFEQREFLVQRCRRGGRQVAHGFQVVLNFGFLESAEAGTGWNQVSEDHIFFQPDQVVDASCEGGFGQHLGGFLETGG